MSIDWFSHLSHTPARLLDVAYASVGEVFTLVEGEEVVVERRQQPVVLPGECQLVDIWETEISLLSGRF